MSLLLTGFVLSLDLLLTSLLLDEGFLSFLDLSDGLLSKGFSIFGLGGFEFFDCIKSDTFDGSFDFESFLFL